MKPESDNPNTCEPGGRTTEEELVVARAHFEACMEDNQALVQVSRQRVDKIVELHLELSRLHEEIRQLKRWKAEALTVEKWWNEIDAFVRDHPLAILGNSVSRTALAWLKEWDELRQFTGSEIYRQARELR